MGSQGQSHQTQPQLKCLMCSHVLILQWTPCLYGFLDFEANFEMLSDI